MPDGTPLHSLRIKQDVGDYEPEYDEVTLNFWPDGSVTWEKFQYSWDRRGGYPNA